MRADEVESLLATRGRDLLRLAYQLTHERASAEDLVQDAALRMLRYPAAGAIGSPYAYAKTVMIRLSYDQASKAARERLDANPHEDRDERDRSADPIGRIVLWEALGRLTHQARTVLVLRYYADFTDKQIAETLGCPRGTVRSTISRALADLRQHDAANREEIDHER